MAKVLTEAPSRFQITLCGVDWSRYMRSLIGLKKTSRMLPIRDEVNDSDNQTFTSEFLAQNITLEKDEEKRGELVKDYVVMVLSEWAGISSSSEIDLNKSLYNYGFDSAGALTLKMQFEGNLQVSFEVGFENNRLPADWNHLQITIGIFLEMFLYKLTRYKRYSCFRFSISCSLIRPRLKLQMTSSPGLAVEQLVINFKITSP